MPSILELNNISKSIGELVLFEQVDLNINIGDKAALVGVNGAGKTTLLNIISNKDSADSGSVTISSGAKLTYLPQDPVLPEEKSVMDAVFQSENEFVGLIKKYNTSLINQNLSEIEHISNQMDIMKAWDYENKIKQMLSQLNIIHYNKKISELSGGQRKRVALANALIDEPDFLVLDEPTNHLDIKAIEWLENYLMKSKTTVLMVTHDRFFLDKVCNTILELDGKRLFKYEGNYNSFVSQRNKRIELEQQEVSKAQNLLRTEEKWMKRMPKARGSKSKYRIDSYHQLKQKSINTRDDKNININVHESRLGSKIINLEHVSYKWETTVILDDFNYSFVKHEKVGIIGANGCGKSTFLDIITQKIAPQSGAINIGETIKIGYYQQDGMEFNKEEKVIDALSKIADTVTLSDGSTITSSQFLTHFLFPPKRQQDKIYKLSGGEKRRLYLCTVLIKKPNFLILDEPTNDLDIETLQVLEDYLAAIDGCVLVVSHDRKFMDNIVDHLFVFKGNGEIKDFPGNYSQFFEHEKHQERNTIKENPSKPKNKPARDKSKKRTYKEKVELEKLEKNIELFENRKHELETTLNSGDLLPKDLTQKSEELGKTIDELEKMEFRWLELSEKKS